jgi:rRNA maturation endonuclease Nob1
MADKEYNLECDDCGSVFTIITQEKDKPTTCCFCGSDLTVKKDNYDDEDDE